MTAPRWEDARDHALKLLREERTSLVAELPRIESVDERELFDAWVARVDLALATIGRIDDAALARLAEPAQSSAAERWRRVPADAKADARMIVEGEIAGCQGDGVCAECDALRALLALAREAEGTPAPAESAPPPEPERTPCPRCGKPLARRGVYHVCPHRVPCGSSGWCSACANRSGT